MIMVNSLIAYGFQCLVIQCWLNEFLFALNNAGIVFDFDCPVLLN